MSDAAQVPAPAETAPEANPAAPAPETVTLTKEEHEKLLQDLGSLKRENKDLKKPKEEAPAAPNPDATELSLGQKAYLRSAGITDQDEVDLALSTSKKWGMTIDQIVDDEDFKAKLDKLRTEKANIAATANVPGGPGSRSATQTAEFYIARGTPPTAAEVPDRKTRAGIVRAMMESSRTGGKKFYND